MNRKNKKICRMFSVLLCAGILCGMLPPDRSYMFSGHFFNTADTSRSGKKTEQESNSVSGTESGTVKMNGALSSLSVLPGRFNPRGEEGNPVVKSQGSYGTCWALAATSALEASLPLDIRVPFSADHMALNNRFVTSLSDGGDYVMVMAYLSGWQGPVPEEEDPYGDAYSPDGLSPSVHVQEIRLLEGCTREEIKEAVFRYGAVQTSLYMSRGETDPEKGYYNPVNAAWYYPQKKTQNHDVIILGWDDDYSRFHFAQIPPEDGAFVCQNSWGEKFGEKGIFYVSYADANIAGTGLAYSRIEEADNYDFLYQTDDCGWVGQQGYASETCWFANVYTAGEKTMADDGVEAAVERASSGKEAAAAEEKTVSDNEVEAAVERAGSGKEAAAAEEKTVPDNEVEAAVERAGSGKKAAVAVESADEEKDSRGQNLQLAAFGFYATGPDTVCELYLVHDFESPASFSAMEFLQRNELEQAGYYTVDLNEPEALDPGERFAMIVKITTPGVQHPAAVEYPADVYSQNVTTKGKEGYLSQDGKYWENTEQRFGSNVCLKGYLLSL